MKERNRPGNTPVEQQERPAAEAERNRPVSRSISGPGAADFLTAIGGVDRPESGNKGMAQTRDGGLADQDRESLAPRFDRDEDEPPKTA